MALILGGTGAHKFYLGKPAQGLFYLVFIWTFVPAIVGFVEGLNFALMSDQVFLDRYDGTPTNPGEVRCPECREIVRADARKCKHCGSGLLPKV